MALGLHAVVLAVMLSAHPAGVAPVQQEAMGIQFVELGPAPGPAPKAKLQPYRQPEPKAEPETSPRVTPKPGLNGLVQSAPEPGPPASVPAKPPKRAQAPPARQRSAPHAQATPARQRSVPHAQATPAPRHQPAPHARLADRSDLEPVQAAGATAPALAGGATRTAQSQGRPQALEPERPRTVGRVDYLGRRPSPTYPRLSERRGEQGRVVLRVLISPEGRVAQVKVQQSSGYDRLDEAAIEAMRQARFRPYTENGIAYQALVDIPFDFVL